jgi:hypothetical protein
VGGALRKNPHAPVVPCHRVVASDRTLGGFSGVWQAGAPELLPLPTRRELLEAEAAPLEPEPADAPADGAAQPGMPAPAGGPEELGVPVIDDGRLNSIPDLLPSLRNENLAQKR